jgi:hypothetical protein
VSISTENENGSSDFTAAERRFRNQFLDSLWCADDPDEAQDGKVFNNEGLSQVQNDATATDVIGSTTVQNSIMLHPGLFKVSQQCPTTSERMLMRGLLKLVQSFGYP